MRKLVKYLLRKLLPQTLCVTVNGNHFREGEILKSVKGTALILRKEVVKRGHYIVNSNLYCIVYKPTRFKSWNQRVLRFYKWLAYHDLIC
jgi:hypothetical protein